MSKEERNWHPRFVEYMEFIANHPNYKGLPIERKANGELSWIATAQSIIGQQRKCWAVEKADQLGIPNVPGMYAKVMLEIHPTQNKICQVCGEEMSLYYMYPNKWLVVALKKQYGYDFTQTDSIDVIVRELINDGVREKDVKEFFIYKFKIDSASSNIEIDGLIKLCEQKCRLGGSSLLGPGAMSNFPDRYDGFHTYNRCCRAEQDKGRSKDNMKTYTKDRRAYELWSDGNIHAANKFMGSSFFEDTSADHIGPISLGFVHDPRYLRPMSKGENSSKRDRLLFEDIEEIISVFNSTNVYPMSMCSAKIWEYIKNNYACNKDKIEYYRLALKQNMANYMEVLWEIVHSCEKSGIDFLIKILLEPKFECFEHSYGFNEIGEIINQSPRRITDSTRKEVDRFIRIAFQAIEDFHEKENRNVKTTLDSSDKLLLKDICYFINT